MFPILFAAAALHDLAALEAQVASIAGAPVAIDRRLRLAQCSAPPVIARAAAGLSVECASPPWRIYVAAQRLASLVPMVRRGDPVSVAASGRGFSVSVDGVAENDASVGSRVRVRDGGGAHLTAVVLPDGSLAAPGYTLP